MTPTETVSRLRRLTDDWRKEEKQLCEQLGSEIIPHSMRARRIKDTKAIDAAVEMIKRMESDLRLIAETDPVYAALDPQRAARIAVHSLYIAPGAQPTPSVPECPYPCGWRNLLKLAIEDGAYLASSINEDEPVTENARAVTMRMVMRLRDVLMAINNAAPEAKP